MELLASRWLLLFHGLIMSTLGSLMWANQVCHVGWYFWLLFSRASLPSPAQPWYQRALCSSIEKEMINLKFRCETRSARRHPRLEWAFQDESAACDIILWYIFHFVTRGSLKPDTQATAVLGAMLCDGLFIKISWHCHELTSEFIAFILDCCSQSSFQSLGLFIKFIVLLLFSGV